MNAAVDYKIEFIDSPAINREKWDHCIETSLNRQVYAFSWYLDSMAPGWRALVVGDYEMVMPLTGKSKWGIQYLYQPLFVQQLGVFSPAKLSADSINRFIYNAFGKYRHIHINLNQGNVFTGIDANLEKRYTYLLNLKMSYEDLRKNYSKSHKKNIRKAEASGLAVAQEKSPGILLDMMQEMYHRKSVNEFSDKIAARLKEMISHALHQKKGELYAVQKDGEYLAAAFFLLSGNQAVIHSASTLEGRKYAAAIYLIDHFIRKHAGESLTLDFAGSIIPGIAKRNMGFGAQPEIYFNILKSRIPGFLLRMI
mgnify:CR=1 FL=1